MDGEPFVLCCLLHIIAVRAVYSKLQKSLNSVCSLEYCKNFTNVSIVFKLNILWAYIEMYGSLTVIGP